jgi:hypothetical protein
VDPKAGLDDVKKRTFLTLSGLELRPLGRSTRSHSLYRLRYPGPYIYIYTFYILFRQVKLILKTSFNNKTADVLSPGPQTRFVT